MPSAIANLFSGSSGQTNVQHQMTPQMQQQISQFTASLPPGLPDNIKQQLISQFTQKLNNGLVSPDNELAGFNANQTAQTANINTLQGEAAGTSGPSAADMMLRQAQNNSESQAASAIGSQRGLNTALADRQIVDNNSQIAGQTAGNLATQRAQEQLNAQSQLNAALGTQGQQQIGAAGTQNQLYGINAGVATGNAANQQSESNAIIGGLAGGAAAALTPTPTPKWGGGAIVPGKAPMPNQDSPMNDLVAAKLSPGEIVLPLSVTKAKNSPEKARAFVQAILRKKAAAGRS